MKDVLAYVDKKIALADEHPLFSWLASDETSPKDRLMLLPSVVNMAMGFRDVNKWVLRYPQAGGELERGINVHTFEDQTHSRLFLEDWRRLGLDERLGWRAGDTLWWLFLADDNETARRHGVHFMSLAALDGGDPLLRFAQAEVAERCARDLFFRHASAVASELTRETGVEYLYLGPHHIAAEGEGAEGLFETRVLDDRRRGQAMELVDTMFEIFVEAFDTILSYALTYGVTGARPRRPARGPLRAVRDGAQTDEVVHATQAPVERLLKERKARTASHPLFTWFRHRGPGISALQAVRRFFPLWAMDVMSRRDLNAYAMTYPHPGTELEHAVNTWAGELATHNALYLDDWSELGLDDLLGWTAAETLEFCYLDRRLDRGRRDRANLVALASGHRDPLVRLWLMRALESTAEVVADGTAIIAAEAETDAGLRLDFLAGRHRPGRPPETPFTRRPMTAGQADAVAELLETVFDAADDHLDLTLDVALSNDFKIP